MTDVDRPQALDEAVEAALHSRTCDGCATEPVIWLIHAPCTCRFPLCVSHASNEWRLWEAEKHGVNDCRTCQQTITQIRWEAL